MSCQRIRDKKDAVKYLGKRCIVYFTTKDIDTLEEFLASVSGIIRNVTSTDIQLNWGTFIPYTYIKRIVVPTIVPVLNKEGIDAQYEAFMADDAHKSQ